MPKYTARTKLYVKGQGRIAVGEVVELTKEAADDLGDLVKAGGATTPKAKRKSGGKRKTKEEAPDESKEGEGESGSEE